MGLRNFLEKLSRGKILKRTLPAKYGRLKIFVSPEAVLRYYKLKLDSIDRVVTNTVDLFIGENERIWDVGANLGIFSLCSVGKHMSCTSVCFEPDIFMCELLRRSIEKNHLPITLLPFAVASESLNFLDFEISQRSRATNHLSSVQGSSQTGGTRLTKKVPAISLDDMLKFFPAPTFIKIDVEGAEKLVFEGGKKVLEKRPKILVEVNDDSYLPILQQLLDSKYNCYDANTLPKLIPLTSSSKSDNIIAIPG